ncbi:hypothetical protein D3C86_1646580 [compost metagenome]
MIEIQGEIVEARHREVEAGADQVGLAFAFAILVSHGQQHILDRAVFEAAVEDLAQGQTRAELAVKGVAAFAAVLFAVVEDLVDEQEVVAIFPSVGMFERHRLLDRRVDLEVLAVQVAQAVGLPQQQIAGHGLAGGQKTTAQQYACVYPDHLLLPLVVIVRGTGSH